MNAKKAPLGALPIPGRQAENRSHSNTLASHHRGLLEASAIPAEVAAAAGVRSILTVADLPEALRWCRTAPGLLFHWHPLQGASVPQYRPDTPVKGPDGRERKYVFPTGTTPPLNIVPAMRSRSGTASKVVLVEGTKQTLAAVAHAPDDVLVVGVAGCWGWSHDGCPVPELDQLRLEGVPVVVAFDADAATNPNVYDAAQRLGEHLAAIGASEVRHLSIPASGNTGLDDYLAGVADPAAVFGRLLGKARKLGRRPRSKASTDLFNDDGIRVVKVYDTIRADHHLAVDTAGRIAVYADGVYRADRRYGANFAAIVANLLDDRFRSSHLRTVEEFTVAMLKRDGAVIPEVPVTGWVNVTNGMLDPLTGELHAHDPALLSTTQLPINWNPGARCPAFDRWVTEVAGELAEDLLEAAAQVLERRPGRQRRALFLYGPSRSGKSTFLRILEHMVGEYRSAVTLHQLATDTFAAADLVDKVLNAAADLSAAHLEDLSLFKMLSGDDPVRAQRKYGQPFTFRATCLFVFSTNSIPTTAEASTAYLNRIRPIRFGTSFAGHEDPSVEEKLIFELEGILVQLVTAYRRFTMRGNYADTQATRVAAERFARASDRVRLFLAEATDPDLDGWVKRRHLYDTFEVWCRENHRHPLGAHKFYELLASAGYPTTKRHGDRGLAGLRIRTRDDWGTDDENGDGGQKGQKSPTSPTCEGKQGEKEPHAREKEAEPAPSAPHESAGLLWDNPLKPPSVDDPGEEYF